MHQKKNQEMQSKFMTSYFSTEDFVNNIMDAVNAKLYNIRPRAAKAIFNELSLHSLLATWEMMDTKENNFGDGSTITPRNDSQQSKDLLWSLLKRNNIFQEIASPSPSKKLLFHDQVNRAFKQLGPVDQDWNSAATYFEEFTLKHKVIAQLVGA